MSVGRVYTLFVLTGHGHGDHKPPRCLWIVGLHPPASAALVLVLVVCLVHEGIGVSFVVAGASVEVFPASLIAVPPHVDLAPFFNSGGLETAVSNREVWVVAFFEELYIREDAWDFLFHLSTSLSPVLMRTYPDLAAKGLGTLGAYGMLDMLCNRFVLAHFFAMAGDYDVESYPDGGGAGHIWPGVHSIAGTVRQAGVLSPPSSPPTTFCFMIPKSGAKVGLISSCIGMNELAGKPPHFDLQPWEKIARFLANAALGIQGYATHVDLSNAFWSFLLPARAQRAFCFR